MSTFTDHPSRRDFIKRVGILTAGATTLGTEAFSKEDLGMFFQISLAEWSFHRALQSGKLDNLDFPAKAKKDFGINAVEYVNLFFMDKASDTTYLNELKKRCSDLGVRSLLIMCDGEGSLADPDNSKRDVAVTNHYKWVDAANTLGCHSIRVNCNGEGSADAIAKAGIEGLRKLSDYGRKANINVIVENHGGLASNGQWLANVIKSVAMPNCGTLPDFDNFDITPTEWYDRYQGVAELMPFAKAVSAKGIDFDDQGNCVETDYVRMLKIVKAAGYRGFIGAEYEGNILSEEDGVRATIRLLERVGNAMN